MSDLESSASSAIQAPPIRIQSKYNKTNQHEQSDSVTKIAPEKPEEPKIEVPQEVPKPMAKYKRIFIIVCLILMMLIITYLYMNPRIMSNENKQAVLDNEVVAPKELPEKINDSVWDKPHHHLDPFFTVQV